VVLDELKTMGVLDNTIVIFSSDHGEMLGSHGKQGKNVIEMEAMAIPFIVHWPKGLRPGVNNLLMSVPDVLPTTMGLAGLEKNIPSEIQGTNFASLISDPNTNLVKKPEAVLLMLGNSRGVLSDRYTLCLRENKVYGKGNKIIESFIYDNKNDPYQMHKISLNKNPKLSQNLLNILGQKLKMANDPWYQEKKYSDMIPY